jgi:hypothetical protein
MTASDPKRAWWLKGYVRRCNLIPGLLVRVAHPLLALSHREGLFATSHIVQKVVLPVKRRHRLELNSVQTPHVLVVLRKRKSLSLPEIL